MLSHSLPRCKLELHPHFMRAFLLEKKEGKVLAFQEMLDFLRTSNPPLVKSGRAISQCVYKLQSPGELLPKVSQAFR